MSGPRGDDTGLAARLQVVTEFVGVRSVCEGCDTEAIEDTPGTKVGSLNVHARAIEQI